MVAKLRLKDDCKSLTKRRFSLRIRNRNKKIHIDEIDRRFPHLIGEIFGQLDDGNLAICKKVGRIWNAAMQNERLFYIRKIQKLTQNCKEYQKDWKKSMRKIPIEFLKEFAICVNNYFKNRCNKQKHPLQIVISLGSNDLFKKLETKFNVSNIQGDY